MTLLIGVVNADIETVKADAIVNAANETLLGGGGVDGAIHKAAGPRLAEYCSRLPTKGKARCGIDDYIRCRPGEAVITPSFAMANCSSIIHTVGPQWEGGWFGEDKTLSKCYVNCLNVALANDIHRIAFPCISTGVYRFPLRLATEIAVYTVCDWIRKHQRHEMEVVFVTHTERAWEIYDEMIKTYYDHHTRSGKEKQN